MEQKSHPNTKTPPLHLGEMERFIVVPLGIIIFFFGVALAQTGYYQWTRGETAIALKYWGFAMLTWGGSLDPINMLWSMLPFTAGSLTASPPYARLALIAIILSLLLFLAAWLVSAGSTPPSL